MVVRFSSVLLSLALVPACTPDATVETETASEDATAEETDGGGVPPATFWQDAAPVFFDHCVKCHKAPGLAPFPLDDYDTAAQWAELLRASVIDRSMPPWLVTDDGSCGEFLHSRTLSDEAIDAIVRWVDDGALEGVPRDDLQPVVLPQLEGGKEIVAFSTPEFTPQPEGGVFSQFDEYRCFAVDTPAEADRFITGYLGVPGNEALVHHVIALDVDPERVTLSGKTNGEVMSALDADSPERDGWPCFGLAGEGVEPEGVPATWTPGQGATPFPPTTGYRLGAGHQLVVQVHYNMADPAVIGQSDLTRLLFRFEGSVEREGFFELPDGFLQTLGTGSPATLPAGQSAYPHTWELPNVHGDVDIYGVLPHMHDRGTKLHAEVVSPEGAATCLVDVPRWDFAWQIYYFLETPLRLGANDSLRVTCTYDTTGLEGPTVPGWGTHNEMCLTGLFLVPVQ